MKKKLSIGLSSILFINMITATPLYTTAETLSPETQTSEKSPTEQLEQIVVPTEPSDNLTVEDSKNEIISEIPEDTEFTVIDNGDGTATINGYTGQDTNIVIPETLNGLTVTDIGDEAFVAKNLTSVSLPYGLINIGKGAFKNNNLTIIEVPETVKIIKEFAFSENELTDVEIRGSIDIIESQAFSFNKIDTFTVHGDLKEVGLSTGRESVFGNASQGDLNKVNVAIHGDIGTIHDYAFSHDTVASLLINGNVGTIGEFSLSNSGLAMTSVEINGDIESVGDYAFMNVQLGSFEVKGNINNIGSYSFLDAKIDTFKIEGNIYSINPYGFIRLIGNSVTINGTIGTIGASAFLESKIDHLLINNNVETIKNGVFQGINFETLVVNGRVGLIEQGAFLTANITDELIIKDGVENIAAYAATQLKANKMDIFKDIRYIGEYAFLNIETTSDIVLPSTIENLGVGIFLGSSFNSLTVEEGVPYIPENAFIESTVKSISLPKTVDYVGASAFIDSGITRLIINEGINSIKDFAFYSNELSCVTIPKSVKSIGESAFAKDEEEQPDNNNSLVIFGTPGTEAERYANEEGYTFIENTPWLNTCDLHDWSIVVEYVDDTGAIIDSKIINKPAEGTHTEQAIEIEDYTLKSDKTVSVEVTTDNPSHTITFNYEKSSPPIPPVILGTVTVNYVDEAGKALDTKTIEDLPLGTHTEQAKEIKGYTLKGDKTLSVEVTKDNLSHTITFNYEKNSQPVILGTVTVNYIDQAGNVLDTKTIKNAPLGTHTEQAKEIAGYTLKGDKTVSVEVTKDNLSHTITFNYVKVPPVTVTPLPVPPVAETPIPPVTEKPNVPKDPIINQKGKRVIRDEGKGIFSTVPHYLDENYQLKITTKYPKGLLITDRVVSNFKDTKGLFSYQEVEDLYNYLIVNGTTATTYSPYANITRGQFSAMIARALELKPTSKKRKFKDVSYYADEVQALYEAGIVTGFTDGTFVEQKALSRQQAAAMITRMLRYMDVDTTPKGNVQLADMNQISDYAKPAVKYLAAHDVLISGTDTKFNPFTNLTRAQMAKVLMRSLQLSAWY